MLDRLIDQNAQGKIDVEAAGNGCVNGSQGFQILHMPFSLNIQTRVFQCQRRSLGETGHQAFVIRAEGALFRALHVNGPDYIVPNFKRDGQFGLGRLPIGKVVRVRIHIWNVGRFACAHRPRNYAVPVQGQFCVSDLVCIRPDRGLTHQLIRVPLGDK